MISAPTLNAVLNASSGVLLTCGFVMIRQRRITAHKTCMLLAFACSTVFLACYVLYHLRVGAVYFLGTGWIRPAYFILLTTHTILATAIVPLAIITLSRALSAKYDKHKRIARWTLPIWLYVSVTGVVIYFLLYHIYPHSGT